MTAAGRGPHLLVMAKAPVPGRVKTRLVPPCTPDQAAGIAAAALADTLDAVARCGAARRVLSLDGAPGEWLPPGFDVVAQRGATFAERLTSAWLHAGGPGVQIGMDTPQLTAADLDSALDTLDVRAPDAVLGPARDGGWWAIGFRRAHRGAFRGVPMSTPDTGRLQRAQLAALGLGVVDLDTRSDVDTFADAVEVAAAAPAGRFAAAVLDVAATLEVRA
jgi:rSAM/selenodomain-associated transferase 1